MGREKETALEDAKGEKKIIILNYINKQVIGKKWFTLPVSEMLTFYHDSLFGERLAAPSQEVVSSRKSGPQLEQV